LALIKLSFNRLFPITRRALMAQPTCIWSSTAILLRRRVHRIVGMQVRPPPQQTCCLLPVGRCVLRGIEPTGRQGWSRSGSGAGKADVTTTGDNGDFTAVRQGPPKHSFGALLSPVADLLPS
jgi:hypothetical protein